ncbi:MAG: hypothetical protein ACI4LX_01480 [Treponema sp.]
MNSNAAVHEYTHLWDNYTQRTNPELWEKGLNLFKNTSLWNDVLNDENYADIKDNEDLVLSECHARICGKIADAVLQKVLEKDGDLKQAEMIDWDKETWDYIASEIGFQEFDKVAPALKLRNDDLKEFLSMPMKDLFVNERKLEINQENGHRKQIEVQNIRSIHDRNVVAKNGIDLIQKWANDGLCRYVDDKKITDWSSLARVYFPIELIQSDNNKILTKSELVNSQQVQKNQPVLKYEDKIGKDNLEKIKTHFEKNIPDGTEKFKRLNISEARTVKEVASDVEKAFGFDKLDKKYSAKLEKDFFDTCGIKVESKNDFIKRQNQNDRNQDAGKRDIEPDKEYPAYTDDSGMDY